MGIVEFDAALDQIIIRSHLILYGNAATASLAEQMRAEIENMWNEPNAVVRINGRRLTVTFRITAEVQAAIQPLEIYRNANALNNFFRVEEFSSLNISFVDGIGCNSGYFFTENLYTGSTTAAHEYGHTLGLDHPLQLDIRGKGRPGIMYPRGTLVDLEFQYDPAIPAGMTGGTMHPMHRRVSQEDIDKLRLDRMGVMTDKYVVGGFTNVYHESHVKFKS